VLSTEAASDLGASAAPLAKCTRMQSSDNDISRKKCTGILALTYQDTVKYVIARPDNAGNLIGD